MPTLFLTLKGQYFDEILAGTKTKEFREQTPFWRRRLEGRVYDQIVLTRGYPKDGGVEGKTRLTLPYRGYTVEKINHPHFGDKAVRVFAIDVERRA